VVHSDLKPSNILVSSDGIPHLLDFGIARLLADAGEDGYHTQTLWPCSPRYSSPEQIRNEAVTTATDIFALGIILCELVTGNHPFDPARLGKGFDLIERICRDEPAISVKQSALLGLQRGWQARQFGSDLTLIIRKALNRKPEDRYPNVESLSDDVQRCLDRRPISIKGHELLYRVQKLIQRHPGTTSASAVAAMLAVAAIFLTLLLGQIAQRNSKYVRDQRDLADTLMTLRIANGAVANEEKARDSHHEIWDYDSESPGASSRGNYAAAKEVAMALENMVQRWNAQDMEGYLDFCWRSPELVIVQNGALFCGWQTLHDYYCQEYKNANMGYATMTKVKVRVLDADSAYAVDCWTVAFPKATVVGMETYYLRRMDGRWKVTMGHSTNGEM